LSIARLSQGHCPVSVTVTRLLLPFDVFYPRCASTCPYLNCPPFPHLCCGNSFVPLSIRPFRPRNILSVVHINLPQHSTVFTFLPDMSTASYPVCSGQPFYSLRRRGGASAILDTSHPYLASTSHVRPKALPSFSLSFCTQVSLLVVPFPTCVSSLL